MLNSFTGIGNLARDPEMRETGSGKKVVNFAVACTSGYGDNKQVEFVNVVAWEKTAEVVAQFCKKGSKVYFEGRLATRSWEDKDGGKRYTTECVANRVLFLDRAADSTGSSDNAPSLDF